MLSESLEPVAGDGQQGGPSEQSGQVSDELSPVRTRAGLRRRPRGPGKFAVAPPLPSKTPTHATQRKRYADVRRRSIVEDPLTPQSLDVHSPQHTKLESQPPTPSQHGDPPTPSTALQRTPSSQTNRQFDRLMHHFIHGVATRLSAHRHGNEAWRYQYPRLALTNDALKHAMMSQAAAHLMNNGVERQNMELQSSWHHIAALKALRQSLQEPGHDPCVVFLSQLVIGAAHHFFGRTYEWRHHLSGAMTMAIAHFNNEEWLSRASDTRALQIMCMMRLRHWVDGLGLRLDQTQYTVSDNFPREIDFIETVLQTPGRWEPVYPTLELNACFMAAARVMQDVRTKGMTPDNEATVDDVCMRLRALTLLVPVFSDEAAKWDPAPSLILLNQHITALGLIVRLLRGTMNPPPRELLTYTSPLFTAVAWYVSFEKKTWTQAHNPPGPHVWPCFHAAMELYNPWDQDRARKSWLITCEGSGIGGHDSIKKVVEEVWRVRDRLAKTRRARQSGTDLHDPAGDVVVDWKDVMRKLDVDFALVSW